MVTPDSGYGSPMDINLSARAEGKEPKDRVFFTNDQGSPLTRTDAIFPIISRHKISGKYSYVGTGFYIHHSGLLVSSTHVFLEAFVEKRPPPAFRGLHASQYLQSEELQIIHFSEGDSCTIRPILRFSKMDLSHDRHLDVAVGVAAQMENENGDKLYPKQQLKFSGQTPDIGEAITTYSFTDNSFEQGTAIEMHFAPGFYTGSFVFEDDERRKAGMPYCRVKMHVHPGTSGAPVFDSRGKVWGVCSQSDESDKTEAWVTPVREILGIEVSETKNPDSDGGRVCRIVDLVNEGVINFSRH